MKTIRLTNSPRCAIVDDEDFERVSRFQWQLDRGRSLTDLVYARAKIRGKMIRMHRLIMRLVRRPSIKLDHRNNDGLDNRRKNLRVLPRNGCNTMNARPRTGHSSRFKGVHWYAYGYNRWCAKIRVDGRLLHLGYFEVEKDAAQAYNRAARRHFGKFAWLNPV